MTEKPVMQSERNQPIATVDAVVLTLEGDALKVLLHRRPNDPFMGKWALPGGYIRTESDADALAAIQRVLKEKTNTSGFYLEQLATFSGQDRDPRGWSVSISYLALVPRPKLKVPDDENVMLVCVDSLPDLAFDHHQIITDALERLRGKGAYSTLPATFLGSDFTLSDLQHAYEVVLGRSLDPSSFRRKVITLGLVEETSNFRQVSNKRPAKVYKMRGRGRTLDRTLGQSN